MHTRDERKRGGKALGGDRGASSLRRGQSEYDLRPATVGSDTVVALNGTAVALNGTAVALNGTAVALNCTVSGHRN